MDLVDSNDIPARLSHAYTPCPKLETSTFQTGVYLLSMFITLSLHGNEEIEYILATTQASIREDAQPWPGLERRVNTKGHTLFCLRYTVFLCAEATLQGFIGVVHRAAYLTTNRFAHYMTNCKLLGNDQQYAAAYPCPDIQETVLVRCKRRSWPQKE